jgi:hypothetical protein
VSQKTNLHSQWPCWEPLNQYWYPVLQSRGHSFFSYLEDTGFLNAHRPLEWVKIYLEFPWSLQQSEGDYGHIFYNLSPIYLTAQEARQRKWVGCLGNLTMRPCSMLCRLKLCRYNTSCESKRHRLSFLYPMKTYTI